jgi:hypothetical protein
MAVELHMHDPDKKRFLININLPHRDSLRHYKGDKPGVKLLAQFIDVLPYLAAIGVWAVLTLWT